MFLVFSLDFWTQPVRKETMREITGNLFESVNADAICITTNGYRFIKKDRVVNVMGRGCAGAAKKHWPGIDFLVGHRLYTQGDKVHVLTEVGVGKKKCILFVDPGNSPKKYTVPYHILTFPVKPFNFVVDSNQSNVLPYLRKNPTFQPGYAPGWGSPALMSLIEKSAKELLEVTNQRDWNSVILPRPGCGAGELNWDEVRPLLSGILDDRFHAITFK